MEHVTVTEYEVRPLTLTACEDDLGRVTIRRC